MSTETGNVLVTINGPGNVHESASYINRRLPELVDGIISIEFNGGHHSTILARVPADLVAQLKEAGRL